MDLIDFHYMAKTILQNIFFCVPQKKVVSLKGLGQHEGEYMTEFSFFCVNYPWTIPLFIQYIILYDSHTGWGRPQIFSTPPTVEMWEIIFSWNRAASNEIQTSFSRIHLEHGFDCVTEEMRYHQRASGITIAREEETVRSVAAFVWPFIKMLMWLWHVPSSSFA